MLDDFFKLNGDSDGHKKFANEGDFYDHLNHSKDLRDGMYVPDVIGKENSTTTKKIENTSFDNFSFRGTVFYKITFISCNFNDCLFTWDKFYECEFIDCRFINSNFHKCAFVQCLADPLQFKIAVHKSAWDKSNIAVHLFDRLYRNAHETFRPDHARYASYLYSKWETRLLYQKYKIKKPYEINWKQFYPKYIWQLLYKGTFGYGYRIRNFLLTFAGIYLISFTVNYSFWNKYKLEKKDVKLLSFDPDTVSIASNIFYTAEATTKLIDSQIQPTSDFGMIMLAFQSMLTFVLLSALITILANRFIGK
jgi:hypothetical protein